MEELKNTDKKGISTKRKIGKTTYEVVVHFNENATETMQDKLKRIMLREMEMKKHQKGDKNDQKVLDKLLQEKRQNLFLSLVVQGLLHLILGNLGT